MEYITKYPKHDIKLLIFLTKKHTIMIKSLLKDLQEDMLQDAIVNLAREITSTMIFVEDMKSLIIRKLCGLADFDEGGYLFNQNYRALHTASDTLKIMKSDFKELSGMTYEKYIKELEKAEKQDKSDEEVLVEILTKITTKNTQK